MPVYVSLLRGINLGAGRTVPMAALRELYGRLGARHIATYIQSGNVIFEIPEADENGLAARLEQEVTAAFGFSIPVLLRDIGAWRRLARRHPLAEGADPAHLHLACLARAPDAEAVRALAAVNAGADRFEIVGREVYLHCPNGYGRTKLNNATLEKKLGTAATTRNWRTVGKLLELAEAAAIGARASPETGNCEASGRLPTRA